MSTRMDEWGEEWWQVLSWGHIEASIHGMCPHLWLKNVDTSIAKKWFCGWRTTAPCHITLPACLPILHYWLWKSCTYFLISFPFHDRRSSFVQLHVCPHLKLNTSHHGPCCYTSCTSTRRASINCAISWVKKKSLVAFRGQHEISQHGTHSISARVDRSLDQQEC